MKNIIHNRRGFLKTSALISAGITAGSMVPFDANAGNSYEEEYPNVIGPRKGYSTEIGTLVSMMTWMREPVVGTVENLTTTQLDYLHDAKSNSIGAMLLHLAATERYYQLNTFNGMRWGSWDNTIKQQWDTPMNLGEQGRQKIKGNNLKYYLDILKEVRENTLIEFKKRDDKWLMQVDNNFPWGPTNNYCKWFHVCEHESNHNGQMKYIKSRLPGAAATND